MKNLGWRWILFWAYGFFVLVTAVLPVPLTPSAFLFGPDKIRHLIEFFILFFTAVIVFPHASFTFPMRCPGLSAAVYGVLMSVLTEGLQAVTPWRHATFFDFLANLAGVGLAYGIYFYYHCRYKICYRGGTGGEK